MSKPILVAGAGGFIGGHLVQALEAQGHDVLGVDIKPPREWWQRGEQSVCLDLRSHTECLAAVSGRPVVFNLAADMGGMGFIETNKSACMINVLINTNLLRAAREYEVERYFFASTACVYPQDLQAGFRGVIPLAEDMAYPADPEDGYGWEKLFGERMCRHFHEDFGIAMRVGRFHMIFGQHGSWTGGREKVPAAFCRKVATAKLTGAREIEVWGDGEQVRSGLFVADAVDAIQAVMASGHPDPLNIGSEETFTVNELLTLIEGIAGTRPLERVYNLDAPQGVRARCSDNTLVRQVAGWEPSVPLIDGLEQTYRWVHDRVAASMR